LSGLFGSGQGKPMATQAQRANGVQVQASNWGKGLPIVYGRARVSGNLIWYGDFQAVEHKQQVGKGGGGGASTSYTYSSSFALALCEGPIQKLGTIWKGSGTLALGDINGTLKTGAAGQSPWSHWSGNEALSYPYVAYVGCLNIKLGSSPHVPNLNFEVYGLLPFNSGTVDDAEPSAILQDLLTSATHGIGFGALGDLSLFRDYCVANSIFISPVVDQETTMLQLIKKLLAVTNSNAVWSGGTLEIIPYSDQTATGNGVTYTPDFTSKADLGPDDFKKPLRIERKPLSSAYNCIRVEYVDRSNNYVTSVAEAKDQADIDRRGVRSMETIQAHAIKDGALAQRVAQWALQRNLYIRNTFRTTIDMRHFARSPGEIVTLTDPQLNLDHLPVRLTEVHESSDNELEIVAEEFAEGVSESAGYAIEPAAGFTPNTEGAPDTTQVPVLFRAPQFLCDQPEVWMGVAGTGKNWGGAHVWVSYDNVSYTQVGTVYPGCRYGTLSAGLATSASDPDTANNFGVALDGPGELNGGSQADADEMVTLMLVDQELVAYSSTTLNGDGTYTLGGGYLRRGCYNTAIAAHAAGAPWLRLDDHFFRWPFDPGDAGKTVYIKLQAFNLYGGGTEDLANLTAVTYTLGQAEEIPDVPADPIDLAVSPRANGNHIAWKLPNPAAVVESSVQYSTDGNTWSDLRVVGGESVDHHFDGPAAYYYRVASRGNSYQFSNWTTTPGATTGGSADNVPDGNSRGTTDVTFLDTGRPIKLHRPTGGIDVSADDFSQHSEVTNHIGGLGQNWIGLDTQAHDGSTYGRFAMSHRDSAGRPIKLWRQTGGIDVSADDFSQHSEVTNHIGGLYQNWIGLDTQAHDGSTYGRFAMSHRDSAGRPIKLWRQTGGIDVTADDLSKHDEVSQHLGGLNNPVVGPAGVDFSLGYANKHGGNIPAGSGIATTLDHGFLKGSPGDPNDMGSVPDSADRFAWKATQQTALLTQKAADNEVIDPAGTSADFWRGAALTGDGGFGGNPVSAGGGGSAANKDGRGNIAYHRVKPGQQVGVYFDVRTAATGTSAARFYAVFVDEARSSIKGYCGPARESAVGTDYGTVVPVPAAAAWVRLVFETHDSGSGGTAPVLGNPRLLVDSQTITKPGGARIGDGRNLIALNTAGYATQYQVSGGWSEIYNSGDNTYTVNEGASVYQVGSAQVDYNNWSSPHLAPGTKFHFAANDPGYAGGAVTLVYSTDPKQVMNQDGLFYLGDWTTGASGGGGGGGGGGKICVGASMLLNRSFRASRACTGARLVLARGFKMRGVCRASAAHPRSGPAVRLVAENGAACVWAKGTGFEQPDGSTVLAEDMLGKPVLTAKGESVVTDVEDLGTQKLMTITTTPPGMSYGAGEDWDNFMIGHNTVCP